MSESDKKEQPKKQAQTQEPRPATQVEDEPGPAERGTGAAGPVRAQPLLERLLRMADGYLEEGNLRQAAEMFFDLVEKHPASSQGELASRKLLEIADRYEAAGQKRQARTIYERLL